MDKSHIIAEIQRTAAVNGGKALGTARFESETGIGEGDWGRYWARFGDAIVDAGLAPNTFQGAYDDEWIFEQLVLFIREIGHFPVSRELKVRGRNNPSFPSGSVFRRLGSKQNLAAKLVDFCSRRDGYGDIVEVCRPVAESQAVSETARIIGDDPTFGYVYLFKSGKHYKIGHSNSAGRRAYELAIQLPEQLTTVHTISTDDPDGIEDYWHRRFASKRLNGEWFSLDAADIRAFKRRKFM